MANKSIVITETDILNKFVEMCSESLSPNMYNVLIDTIIPSLKQARLNLKNKQVGMYGETPKIDIGKFSICEQSIPLGKTVWIELKDGSEGSEFCKKKLEKLIDYFYCTSF